MLSEMESEITMTNREWQKLQETKVKEEKVRGQSKCVGNALRYLAFVEYNRNGLVSATGILKRQIEDIKVNNSGRIDIDDEEIDKICKGLIAELEFFDSCRICLNLCPTLDAGCAFDFVGEVPDCKGFPALGFGGRFIRIDVTTSIECKREKEIISCRGQKHWPLLFAHVHGGKVDWYSEKLDVPLLGKPLKLDDTTSNGHTKSHHVAFARYRRESLERIEFGDKLDEVVREIPNTDKITLEECKILEAQSVFFATFKYALNIVPALSCEDMCDFIGEHDGKLVRYRVLVDTKKYDEDEYPVFKQLSKELRYKVALFNARTRMFDFYDWDDWHLFDDVPAFEDQKKKEEVCHVFD